MSDAASPPIEAVIFDWGGTLADYAVIEMEDMWRLAAHHLAPDDGDAMLAKLVAVEAACWERCATDQRAFTLADLLSEAASDLGVDIAEAAFEQAATHYLDSWTPHIRHDSHAAEVLRALRDRGLRIGLLSNTHWPPAFHERFLARDGLDGLIDARLYTSEMAFMKPHASAFEAALAAVDVESPRRAVFVGDRPFDDIHGAQAVGMRTVLRPNGEVPAYDVTADAEIAALPELVTLIDDWSTARLAERR